MSLLDLIKQRAGPDESKLSQNTFFNAWANINDNKGSGSTSKTGNVGKGKSNVIWDEDNGTWMVDRGDAIPLYFVFEDGTTPGPDDIEFDQDAGEWVGLSEFYNRKKNRTVVD